MIARTPSPPLSPYIMNAEDLLIARLDDLWVLNKPSGTPSHPGSRRVQAPDVLMLARELLDAPEDLAPINRLDRATSGIILCSADAATRATFGALLTSHEITKTYRALVYGHTHKKGIIRTPLHDARRKRELEATTRYRRLETFGSCSYLEVRPETGRKHQIRRHLQSIRHGVVGDRDYPHPRRIKLPAFPGRLWLHAHSLEIPSLNVSFEAPLPAVLLAQLDALRAMRAVTHEEE